MNRVTLDLQALIKRNKIVGWMRCTDESNIFLLPIGTNKIPDIICIMKLKASNQRTWHGIDLTIHQFVKFNLKGTSQGRRPWFECAFSCTEWNTSASFLFPLHHSWYLVSHTLFAKGLNYMLRCLLMSSELIFNMTLSMKINKILRCKLFTLWHLEYHIGVF